MVQPLNPYAPPSAAADYDPRDGARSPSGATLASPGTRWLGAFVDNLVVVAAMIPGFALILVAASDDRNHLEAYGFGAMALGFATAVAVQSFLIAMTGQSLGKKMLGTKIVRLDGGVPGFVYGVLLRSWLPAVIACVPGIGGMFSLVDSVLVFRADRRMLHDLMAGTSVVHLSPGEKISWAPKPP